MSTKSRLISGRVPVTTAANVAADRYQYLDLSSAEPNLGTSSNNGDVLIYDSTATGGRRWIPQSDIVGSIGLFAYGEANTAAANTIYLSGVDITQNNRIAAVETYAAAAFNKANTGGIFTGSVTINQDLSVSGNVLISGNVISHSANNLVINDPLIYIANNNAGNLVDIGIVGNFTSSSYQHTGIVRDATSNQWKLFSNVVAEPTTTVDFTNAIWDDLQLGTLTGNVIAQTVVVNGIDFTQSQDTQNNRITVIEGVNVSQNNRITVIEGVNTTQNTNITGADTKAQEAFNKANLANVLAQAAFDYANTILSIDNNIDQYARDTANTASSNTIVIQGVNTTQNTNITNANTKAQAAFDQANVTAGGLITANSNITVIEGVNVTQNTNITNADTKAQAAFDTANTKLATSGGTITGTLTVNGEAGITGNLTVSNLLTVGTLQIPNAITSNVSLFTGINNTQNTNITAADTKAQAAFDYANTILSLDNNIDQTARNTANSASGNTIYTQGVDTTQNTRMTIIEGVDVGQNTRMTIIEGVDLWQNTQITNVTTLAQSAFNTANTAANAADSFARQTANAAFTQANTATTLAQSAFDKANTASAGSIDQYARDVANTASANTIYTQGVDVTQNTNITAVNNFAAGAYNTANTNATNITAVDNFAAGAYSAANNSNNLAQSAFNTANGANGLAAGAFNAANNKLDLSGGSISGSLSVGQNLTVTGNLIVLGNVATENVSSFTVADPLIVLATGNYFNDVKDIGFAAHYNDGANAHTGILRDASTKEWIFFEGYTPELDANNDINIAHPSFAYSTVNALNFKGNVITSGYNVFNFAQAAFNTANTKLATSGGTITGTLTVNGEVGITGNLIVSGTSVLTTLNATTANIASLASVNASQNTTIQAAFDKANTVSTDVSNFTSLFSAIENTQNTRITAIDSFAQGAYNKANSANVLAQAAFDFANTGGASAAVAAALANAAFIQANTVTITSQAAFDQANTAANSTIYINGINITQNTRIDAAFDKANAAATLAQAAFDQANTGGGGGAGVDQVARNTANAAFAAANTATGNLTSYSETTVSPTISGGTLTIDLSQGTTFNVAVNAAISTLNITNPAATGRTSSALVVFNYNGVSYSVTWPGSFRWPGGVAPALTNTNGKRDIFTFFTMDGGNTYIAIISAQNV